MEICLHTCLDESVAICTDTCVRHASRHVCRRVQTCVHTCVQARMRTCAAGVLHRLTREAHMSIRMPLRVSTYMSTDMSICMSAHMSIHMSTSLYGSIPLSCGEDACPFRTSVPDHERWRREMCGDVQQAVHPSGHVACGHVHELICRCGCGRLYGHLYADVEGNAH